MGPVDKNGLTESEFLTAYAKKNYPKPSLTADIVTFSESKDGSYVLLIKRGQHPFINCWGLPGGFAKPDQSLEETAERELREETNITNVNLIPIGLFSEPGRDPRGWVVSQAYIAYIDKNQCTTIAGDDAAQAAWFRLENNGDTIVLKNSDITIKIGCVLKNGKVKACALSHEKLAFDHGDILIQALHIAKNKSNSKSSC